MTLAILDLLVKRDGLYKWECPTCENGNFSWSEKINIRRGHPFNKAYCGVCNTYHDIEKRNN